ncbi:hypothetical protein BAMA_23840 [Bacillus manliponensis]|uniref:Uncharacterized protein n=1 Tax=Bacillus manliponensis TaxID=574376 RepID=A0A073JVL5_9BACI|nr:hypothetical protein [Bacillus manliponensis]KEK19049.1 hypothetical protein BAMA_23840 [Bacillus manliponensis]
MDEEKEYTLICIGEAAKVKSLQDLVPFQSKLIIFAANEYITSEVKACGFQQAYCCPHDPKIIVKICKGIKKAILLGDELSVISFFTERIRSSFYAPITLVTRNKNYPKHLYETIGVKLVVFTTCDNISFLTLE